MSTPRRKLVRFTAPLHCRRDELADQLLEGALRMYLNDLKYTEQMTVAIVGQVMGAILK